MTKTYTISQDNLYIYFSLILQLNRFEDNLKKIFRYQDSALTVIVDKMIANFINILDNKGMLNHKELDEIYKIIFEEKEFQVSFDKIVKIQNKAEERET